MAAKVPAEVEAAMGNGNPFHGSPSVNGPLRGILRRLADWGGSESGMEAGGADGD